MRSLTFTDDILTIGTGVGVILFFDIRAGRYLESDCGHACSLNVGSGWLVRNSLKKVTNLLYDLIFLVSHKYILKPESLYMIGSFFVFISGKDGFYI